MKSSHLRKIKRNDKIASWVITAGGALIIFCVVGMFVLIAKEAFPLLGSAKTDFVTRLSTQERSAKIVATGMDRYKQTVYTLRSDGSIPVYDLETGSPVETHSLWEDESEKGSRIVAAKPLSEDRYYVRREDGRNQIYSIGFDVSYDSESNREVDISSKLESEINPHGTVVAGDATLTDEGGGLYVTILSDGSAEVDLMLERENFFGEVERINNVNTIKSQRGERFTLLALSSGGNAVYFATNSGAIEKWALDYEGYPSFAEVVPPATGSHPISSIGLALGSDSLAVSRLDGTFATYSMARLPKTGSRGLMAIHTFPEIDRPFVDIQPSPRNKSLYTLDASGTIAAYYLTTEQKLFQLDYDTPIEGFGVSPKGDSLLAWDTENRLVRWDLEIPHPEISFQTLFGKVHYETYDEPAFVWQSSSGSDEFESKFSLIPLIFGSLKGTFYSMFFAAPIAILGAIYTSQFANKHIRDTVKPVIELIGAVPSVVIGFLAALWLAPRMETHLAAFIAFLPLLMLCVMIFLYLWSLVLKTAEVRYRIAGYEFIAMLPAVLAGAYFATAIAPGVENLLFAGNFQQWLYDTLDVTYDQRNSFVIAIALGFIVIPILYTMSDDALVSVPQSLQAASLAVGATRWQTMMRITLPSASPGIFAAIIIGLGRAIGETMIVLMATGNTPILDWSIFNGMRTLSANIAVEIPEAPVGGTLYRVLFLSGIILFVFTSSLNTIAEIIRQRLRKKYGKF